MHKGDTLNELCPPSYEVSSSRTQRTSRINRGLLLRFILPAYIRVSVRSDEYDGPWHILPELLQPRPPIDPSKTTYLHFG